MSNTALTPVDWLDLAKSYFDAAAKLNIVVNDPAQPMKTRLDAYEKSVKLIQEGYALQRMSLDEIAKELGIDVQEVKGAVEKAKKTIKKIRDVGNMIELAGDLIVLAGLLIAPKPTSLVALPAVLKEIRDDIVRMQQA